MSQALTEVEAAAAAGFRLWRHFKLAQRSGLFPAPARVLPGHGAVWTREQIDEWLGVNKGQKLTSQGLTPEQEAMRRARGEHKASAIR